MTHPVCDLAQPDCVDHSQPLTTSFLRSALLQATFGPVGRVQQCSVVVVVVEMAVEHGDHVGVDRDDVGFLVELCRCGSCSTTPLWRSARIACRASPLGWQRATGDDHFFSRATVDVIAGPIVGRPWFFVFAATLGGHLLRFGVPAVCAPRSLEGAPESGISEPGIRASGCPLMFDTDPSGHLPEADVGQ